jgi:hypothetical protein
MTQQPTTHFDNNVQMSSAAIGAHVTNLRAAIPPPLRSICFPESLSAFLRNTIISIGLLDILFFMSSFFTWNSRYLGSTTMMVSLFSLLHISYITILLGNHLVRGIPPQQIYPNGLLDQLNQLSARHTSVFAHGTAFGSTALMALLMHVVWAYFARVSDCVINLDSRLERAYNITHGGHHNGHTTTTPSYSAIDNVNHLICGAYGPVGLVSFLSGILYWLNLSLAIALYVKRTELSGGGIMMQAEYEEIDSDLNLREEDFNNGIMRVMQV